MLNMALLNIMDGGSGGSGGMPDVSNYNILGLMSPAVNLNACGHWPSCVFIWNRYLTTFQMYFRCQDLSCNPMNPRIGVGGNPTIAVEGAERVSVTTPYKNQYASSWGVMTNPFKTGAGFKELICGFIDTLEIEKFYEPEIGTLWNAHIGGYADYWEHLPPIQGQSTLGLTSKMADFMGGTVWQAGMEITLDGRPNFNTAPGPSAACTPYNDGYRLLENWLCIVVPIRGLTAFPKHEFANQMMIGFLQLEYPNQIGYGVSYTFGIAKDPNCLPKKSLVKCGGKISGKNDWEPAPKLFEGFAPFNLDNFLAPFIRKGLLNSYADAAEIYNKLLEMLWASDKATDDYGGINLKGNGAPLGRLFKSWQSIWQGLLDNWLPEPYKSIFMEIGSDPLYYINALQTNYPTECNFYSILGCGRSFDSGIIFNSAICAMVDATSVFKALTTYPDLFPVDLDRLIAAV